MREVIILAVLIATVLGSDPRCLRKTDNDSPHLAHDSNCRKFYTCHSDKHVTEHECPNDLEFNPMLLKCDFPRGFCTPTTKPVQQVMSCNGLSDGAYYPDFSDECKSYYHCQHGVAKIAKCVTGTRFDAISRMCIDETQAQCGKKSAKIDCKNDQINTTFFVHVADGCKSYTMCQNGHSIEAFCEGSLIFNPRTKSCDWPQKVKCGAIKIDDRSDEIHFSDYNDEMCKTKRNGHIVGPNRNAKCASYFTCQNGQLAEHYCGDRLVFNAKIGVCDVPENVEHCQININNAATVDCSNKHDLRFAHPDDCSAYISCRLGQARLHKCAKGQIFDGVKHTCVEDGENLCVKSTSDEYFALLAESTDHKNKNKFNTHVNYANGCRSYYDCKKKRCQEKHCLRNFAFNMEKMRCEPADFVFCDTIESNVVVSGHSSIRKRRDAFAIDCSVKQGNWYEDPTDCTKFYVCVMGNPIRQQCHAGQSFDKTRRLCRSGSCGTTGPNPDPTCINGNLMPDALNPSSYYECVGGVYQHKSCPTGETYNGKPCTSTTPIPTPTPTTCPEGDKLPDSFYPSKYYICLSGVYRSRTCSNGQIYSSSAKACMGGATTQTPTLTPTPAPDATKCTTGLMLPDVFNKSKFYVCYDGHLVSNSCPPGLTFDETQKFCKTGTTSTCTEGTILADPSDTSKFLVCHSGSWVTQSCPPGQTFSTALNYCTSLSPARCVEGTFSPDPSDRTNYYVCHYGNLVLQSCPPYQEFSITLGYCSAGIIPPGPSMNCGGFNHGAFVAHPTENNLYYVCLMGILREQACPVGMEFNPSTLFCINGAPTPPPPPPPGSCGPYDAGTHLPAPGYDYYYLVCVSGIFVVQRCPTDTTYDDSSKSCSNSGSVAPPTGNCGVFEDGDMWYYAESNKKYSICIGGQVRQMDCPSSTQYFNPTALICQNPCDPINKPTWISSTATWYATDPTSSTKYFTCSSLGAITSNSCPTASSFWVAVGGCVPNDKVSICPPGASVISLPLNDADVTPNYSTSGTSYIRCESGVPNVQTCATKTFDIVLGVCI